MENQQYQAYDMQKKDKKFSTTNESKPLSKQHLQKRMEEDVNEVSDNEGKPTTQPASKQGAQQESSAERPQLKLKHQKNSEQQSQEGILGRAESYRKADIAMQLQQSVFQGTQSRMQQQDIFNVSFQQVRAPNSTNILKNLATNFFQQDYAQMYNGGAPAEKSDTQSQAVAGEKLLQQKRLEAQQQIKEMLSNMDKMNSEFKQIKKPDTSESSETSTRIGLYMSQIVVNLQKYSQKDQFYKVWLFEQYGKKWNLKIPTAYFCVRAKDLHVIVTNGQNILLQLKNVKVADVRLVDRQNIKQIHQQQARDPNAQDLVQEQLGTKPDPTAQKPGEQESIFQSMIYEEGQKGRVIQPSESQFLSVYQDNDENQKFFEPRLILKTRSHTVVRPNIQHYCINIIMMFNPIKSKSNLQFRKNVVQTNEFSYYAMHNQNHRF